MVLGRRKWVWNGKENGTSSLLVQFPDDGMGSDGRGECWMGKGKGSW